MTHEDQMRSLRLMGEYVIPAVREMGEELELKGPFEISPWTNEPTEDSNGTTEAAATAGADAGD